MKAVIAALLIAGSGYADQITQIINPKTGFVDVEFIGDEVIIHNRFIQADLEKDGIAIPESMRSQYADQELVFASDPLFSKALREVYCVENEAVQR